MLPGQWLLPRQPIKMHRAGAPSDPAMLIGRQCRSYKPSSTCLSTSPSTGMIPCQACMHSQIHAGVTPWWPAQSPGELTGCTSSTLTSECQAPPSTDSSDPTKTFLAQSIHHDTLQGCQGSNPCLLGSFQKLSGRGKP